MVEALTLQTSIAQTVAAEKVTHVQSHVGDANQQLFTAELAKMDDRRAHEVIKTDKSEQEQRIDEREERKRRAREDEADPQEEQADEALDEEMFVTDECTHLIDITI